jgi:signal peptidase II
VQERRAVTPLSRSRTITPVALAVAAVVLAVDHATKWWALNALDDRDIGLIGNTRLHLVHNHGAAFGFGSRFAPFVALVALAIVIVVFRSTPGLHTPVAQVAVGLVLGGAVGNLLDRLFRAGDGFLGGAVVDFIDVRFWPVWNVADMGISIGAVLLAVTAGRDAPAASTTA